MEKRDRASEAPALYEVNECDVNEDDVTLNTAFKESDGLGWPHERLST